MISDATEEAFLLARPEDRMSSRDTGGISCEKRQQQDIGLSASSHCIS